jgi:hypothetical protein
VIDSAYQSLAETLRALLPRLAWSEEHPKVGSQTLFPAGFVVAAEGQNNSTGPGQIVVPHLGADVVLWVKDAPGVVSRTTLAGYFDLIIAKLTEDPNVRVDSWVFSNGAGITELSIHVELLDL